MVWPILLPLIFLFCCYKNYWGLREKLRYPVGIISPFILLSLFGLSVGLWLSLFFAFPTQWQEPAVVQLTSLKNGGKEFLVHEYGYYIFRTQDQPWYDYVKARDSSAEFNVVQQDSPSGRLEIYRSEFSNLWLWLIAFDLHNSVKYDFYIPKGSLWK